MGERPPFVFTGASRTVFGACLRMPLRELCARSRTRSQSMLRGACRAWLCAWCERLGAAGAAAGAAAPAASPAAAAAAVAVPVAAAASPAPAGAVAGFAFFTGFSSCFISARTSLGSPACCGTKVNEVHGVFAFTLDRLRDAVFVAACSAAATAGVRRAGALAGTVPGAAAPFAGAPSAACVWFAVALVAPAGMAQTAGRRKSRWRQSWGR